MSLQLASHRCTRVETLARLLALFVVLAVALTAARSAGTQAFRAPAPGTGPGVVLPGILPTAAPPSAHVLARGDHLRLTRGLSAGAATATTAAVNASLTYDWISVFGFAPNSSVAVTIRSSPGGTVLATSTKTVSGYGGANFLRGGDHDVDLVTGMQVTADDGTSTKELTLAPLTVSSVDPVADVVAGTTTPGADVYVYVYSSTAYSPTYVVTAGTDGSWRLNLAGIFDVTGVSAASASVSDADGDQTNGYWRPPLLSVSITSDYFWVDGLAPEATVSYTIRDAPGATTLASGSKLTDSTGWAAFYRGTDHAVDLRAGMQVSISDGTTTKR